MISEEAFSTRYYNELNQLHREDGPALIWKSGDQEWFINGIKHREDGPAVVYHNTNIWYKHGKLHREDGPAIEYKLDEVSNQYFLEGKEIAANSLIEFLGIVRFKAFI